MGAYKTVLQAIGGFFGQTAAVGLAAQKLVTERTITIPLGHISGSAPATDQYIDLLTAPAGQRFVLISGFFSPGATANADGTDYRTIKLGKHTLLAGHGTTTLLDTILGSAVDTTAGIAIPFTIAQSTDYIDATESFNLELEIAASGIILGMCSVSLTYRIETTGGD